MTAEALARISVLVKALPINSLTGRRRENEQPRSPREQVADPVDVLDRQRVGQTEHPGQSGSVGLRGVGRQETRQRVPWQHLSRTKITIETPTRAGIAAASRRATISSMALLRDPDVAEVDIPVLRLNEAAYRPAR